MAALTLEQLEEAINNYNTDFFVFKGGCRECGSKTPNAWYWWLFLTYHIEKICLDCFNKDRLGVLENCHLCTTKEIFVIESLGLF